MSDTTYKSKVGYKPPAELEYHEGMPEIKSVKILDQVEEYVVAQCSAAVGMKIDREELIKALRYDRGQYEKGYADGIRDAEDRLEDQLPKRGEWILCGPVGWPKWKCSVCHSEGRGDYIRCPWCGAVMYESNASNASNALNALDNAQDGPIVTPCRGCSDYDGYGGCKSKGGCARKLMDVQDV